MYKSKINVKKCKISEKQNKWTEVKRDLIRAHYCRGQGDVDETAFPHLKNI